MSAYNLELSEGRIFDRARLYRARYKPPVYYANREERLEHLTLLTAQSIDQFESLAVNGSREAHKSRGYHARFISWARGLGAQA